MKQKFNCLKTFLNICCLLKKLVCCILWIMIHEKKNHFSKTFLINLKKKVQEITHSCVNTKNSYSQTDRPDMLVFMKVTFNHEDKRLTRKYSLISYLDLIYRKR